VPAFRAAQGRRRVPPPPDSSPTGRSHIVNAEGRGSAEWFAGALRATGDHAPAADRQSWGRTSTYCRARGSLTVWGRQRRSPCRRPPVVGWASRRRSACRRSKRTAISSLRPNARCNEWYNATWSRATIARHRAMRPVRRVLNAFGRPDIGFPSGNRGMGIRWRIYRAVGTDSRSAFRDEGQIPCLAYESGRMRFGFRERRPELAAQHPGSGAARSKSRFGEKCKLFRRYGARRARSAASPIPRPFC
jgi:hypothetical protein